MKILHLVRSLDIGGLETVVCGLIAQSGARSLESHLGCLYAPGVQAASAGAAGIWIGNLEYNGFWHTLNSLRRYIRKHRIEIIHSHNPQPHLFAVIVSLLTGISVVHTKHGRNYPKNRHRVWLNRQLSLFSKKVVAVSADAADVALHIEKVPPSKVVVIRNGIGVARFNHRKYENGYEQPLQLSNFNPQPSLLTIGTMGRLSKEKNYSMLIRAFASICNELATVHSPQSPANLKLLFVGDGPERDVLEKESEGLNVEFVGMQDHVEDWLKLIDVFCLSSVTEGTSMTLLEAGASGLPSVVTNVGGNSEVVLDGKTGFVVTSGDENEFIIALTKLIEDAALRRQFGLAAKDRIVEFYSVESMMSQYINVYRAILKK